METIRKIWKGEEYQIPLQITKYYLDEHPEFYFVFGDNLIRRGTGGAAVLRYHPQAIGFITKKFPDNQDSSFFTPESYKDVFRSEREYLEDRIQKNPESLFLVSKLGSGFANKYHIYEKIIKPWIMKNLINYKNVVLLIKE